MSRLSQSVEWKTLQQHQQAIANVHLRELFQQDSERFQRFSLEAAGLLLDYSKNRITTETIAKLIKLAEANNLTAKINALFQGAIVNLSEQRPAIHTALRDPQAAKPIQDALTHMQMWVEKITQQQWLGYSGKPITDIINIGIGGSHLGPAMAVNALTPFHNPHLRYHFIANIDSTSLHNTLTKLNPETSLFIISSKTFTTSETLSNADSVKQWLLKAAGHADKIKNHFFAVTAHAQRAIDYGICEQQILPIWEGVGGRFSVCSSVGFIVALAIGMKKFREMLAGAHAMDQHFYHANFSQNMPVILALLQIWYVNFFNAHTQAILPYNENLNLFPAYLQQLEMESNGKHVQQNGDAVDYATSPVIWGNVGTNGQHAFHQLLFQGTQLIPADFIATVNNSYNPTHHQQLLLANCFAQSQALMEGFDDNALPSYQKISGNQPSNTILMAELNPVTLGALVALYEHKVFVESVIWNINCFDQWGVELGKKIAVNLVDQFKDKDNNVAKNASTQGLLNYYWRHKIT